MQKITTLLFDVDGTLLDASEFILQATEHALATFNYPIPERSVIAKNVGKPFPEYYFALTGRATYGFHTDNLHDPEPEFFIKEISELLDIL